MRVKFLLSCIINIVVIDVVIFFVIVVVIVDDVFGAQRNRKNIL